MKERIYIKDLSQYAGQEVHIAGWVNVRRDQGKMVFFDMRDMTGYVQCVALPSREQAIEKAKDIRPEWVLNIKGLVNKRPEKNIKEGVVNGDIELEVLEIEVLNKAETPAFDVVSEGYEIGEENRLKYRFLDLRRDRMQKNIRNRHKVVKFIRDFLDKKSFIEVETPILTKSTPEGARDYVVPSRIWQGKFYALPQSPQQYKQLLMASGAERYFQVAKCMRDEDTRGDRQPEFTQIDMEMSFVDREDVMNLNEELLINVVKNIYSEKEIQEIPFPRITYKESMEKYGTDRPDIRKDKNNPNLLAFCWVVDFPFFERTDKSDNVDTSGEWTFTHNPFSRPQDEHMAMLMDKKDIGDILTTQYDIVLNGSEIGGGSIRNHEPEALEKVFEIMGYEQEVVEKNFGHMIKALGSGCPPHGGIAWGFDRFIMLLQNEPNIREVIAFPKTGEGKDLMMDSPSDISEKQLKELNIKMGK
ncbi:MAG: aspartate--tRNA ligase [Candidatus Pacebacteria bacterium]|nr:aspartate--tRNA ligase [Candidatus Paceibacterota bacterium]MCF7862886.1 aspartate--tRNA ligase [Candidatus Paceibacterota bacterium]